FRRVDRSQGGRFTLPVPRPGSYAVVGFSERFASSLPEFVEVEEGNAHTDASLSLLDFAFISGRVRHASGAPSKGTPIRALPVRGSEPYADVSGETGADYLHVTAEVRAGEDGSFRIQGLHPHATYRLLLPLGPRGTDLRAVARPVPAGTEDLEIVVPEDGSAAVNVVLELASPTQGPDDRPGVELWHETGLGSWKQEERAASEGGKDAPPRGPWRFRLEGLIPGDRYVLHASALGYGAALRGPWTARTGEDERVVRLEAPSTIEVEVRDADGRALPSASVFCERATECDPLRAPMRVLTPAGGVVRFDGLGPGPYRLASVRGTARSEWTAVEVAGGERRALVLTLEP
ncbi:MAG TPA: carboxypeptidase-like regulatory domain-containing protein, partial [Planctomycetota bacterium]|nr:carboxypeptidase-like regulatory domain-containing protein [Planctomycetota bacterium]